MSRLAPPSRELSPLLKFDPAKAYDHQNSLLIFLLKSAHASHLRVSLESNQQEVPCVSLLNPQLDPTGIVVPSLLFQSLATPTGCNGREDVIML